MRALPEGLEPPTVTIEKGGSPRADRHNLWCDAEARRLGISMTELDLMHQIAEYNEVDC